MEASDRVVIADRLRGATYLSSVVRLADLPRDNGREVAFAGRSNSGKSSLINALVGHKRLAHTSKLPGRTRTLVSFEIAHGHRLVDLPGYGYAGAPRDLQLQWHELIPGYLAQRRSLAGVFVLMDIRHPFQDSDMQVLGLLAELAQPVCLVLTKADKLTRSAAQRAQAQARARAGTEAVVACSARTRSELDSIYLTLATWLDLAEEKEKRPRKT